MSRKKLTGAFLVVIRSTLRLNYRMVRAVLRPLGRRRALILERIWSNPSELPDVLPVPDLIRYQMRFHHWMSNIYKFNKWEPKVTNALQGLHGSLFVDVGANLGFYVNYLQSNFSRTVAIEPHPILCEYLRKHHPPNCQVVEKAISKSNGTAEFHIAEGDENFGLSSMLPVRSNLRRNSAREKRRIIVQTETLSKILDGRTADLVKVDVEGAEWQVLEGAEPVMQHVISWIIELHNPEKKAALGNYMKSFGYTCKWLDETHAYFTRPHR